MVMATGHHKITVSNPLQFSYISLLYLKGILKALRSNVDFPNGNRQNVDFQTDNVNFLPTSDSPRRGYVPTAVIR
jgi:hypothetical protein